MGTQVLIKIGIFNEKIILLKITLVIILEAKISSILKENLKAK
jgi:hypothetical protein